MRCRWREAEAEGAKWEADVARGTTGTGAKITLGVYLAEWLQRSARRVRPITLHGYRYLVDSIRRFPRPEPFRQMIAAAGFVRTAAEPMLGGLISIHSGWKI